MGSQEVIRPIKQTHKFKSTNVFKLSKPKVNQEGARNA